VTGELQLHDEDGDARCVHCGAAAVGPCASCDRPVCGDCCVLTEGGAKVYAICLSCDKRAGRSLRAAWRTVALWAIGPLLVLAAAVALLAWITNR
jgi:hypothetical protein